MGDIINDTHPCAGKYITYTHSMQFADMLRQASGGCPAVCSGENSANKHIWTELLKTTAVWQHQTIIIGSCPCSGSRTVTEDAGYH